MRLIAAFCVVAASIAASPAQTSPLKIELPKGVYVNLEVDAREDDLLGLVKDFMGGLGGLPGGVPLKIQGVSIQLPGLQKLLQNVHFVHALGYSNPNNGTDPIPFHESIFRGMGMRRMLFSDDGVNSILVMRPNGKGGLAIVLASQNSVTVIRTDGMPNFRLLASRPTVSAELKVKQVKKPGKPAKRP